MTYLHAGGIDAPVALVKGGRLVLPLTDWRGQPDEGVCGAALCGDIDFPLGRATAYGDQPDYSNGPPSWYGSLLTGLQDGSGYQYRRNRYYDPKTGRFTQEDPIGLAGGVNAYGFANGDPVSYSDPFGLWPLPIIPPMTLALARAMDQLHREAIQWANAQLDRMLQAVLVGAVMGSTGGGGRGSAARAVTAEAAVTEEAAYVASYETRVSRWMSETEYKDFKATGTLQTDGRTFVTLPGAPKPGGTGPVRVDFNVPTDALKSAGNENWRVLMNPSKTPVTAIQRVEIQ